MKSPFRPKVKKVSGGNCHVCKVRPSYAVYKGVVRCSTCHQQFMLGERSRGGGGT